MADYSEALKNICGVTYSETSGKYVMVDSMAWASDAEKNQYVNIKDTSAQNSYKQSVISSKYGDLKSYLNNGVEATAHIDEFNHKVYSELTLCARATDPGYLSALSADERTEIINDYVEWSESHITMVQEEDGLQSHVFGYTDEEYSALSDSEKTSVMTKQNELIAKWSDANFEDEAEPSDDVETETESPSEEKVEAESTTNGTKSVSAWGKITATIGAVGTALVATVKSIYDNKIEPWLESSGFIKGAQEKVESVEVTEEKSTAEIMAGREDAMDTVEQPESDGNVNEYTN